MSLAHASEAATLEHIAGLDFLADPKDLLSGPLPESVERLAARGVTVLAHTVYAGGSLLRSDHHRARSLAGTARALGRDGVADLAVAFVLGHAAIASVALGALTDDHMRHNLQLAAREPLTPQEIEQVQRLLH